MTMKKTITLTFLQPKRQIKTIEVPTRGSFLFEGFTFCVHRATDYTGEQATTGPEKWTVSEHSTGASVGQFPLVRTALEIAPVRLAALKPGLLKRAVAGRLQQITNHTA
jgi:hypothetical protein